jgi:hypothetical protein
MNSTYALNESILMDYVPKETRARWKSLESVASFGWCGSAVVGGLLSDASSYSTTFMYTAGLQLIGALIIAFLLKVVPIEEEDGNGKKTRRSIIDSSNSDNIESGSKIMYNNGSTDDLEEPLLS